MKKIATLFSVVTLVFGMMTGSSHAFGVNITISDENYDTSGGASSWYTNHEDQEVEPGMQTGQRWDLEGFFQNGTQVTMVGGYDFKKGEAGNGSDWWDSGDIFIDVDGNAQYGDIHGSSDGIFEVKSTFGYDFVLDLNEDMTSYSIYRLTSASVVKTAYYQQNQGSSPWQYATGGELIGSLNAGTITYETGLTDAETGFKGDSNNTPTHNAVTVDLAFLSDRNLTQGYQLTSAFTLHYTMGCGNDNLMGKYVAPVPEPSTILLISAGLCGLVGMSRKRLLKK